MHPHPQRQPQPTAATAGPSPTAADASTPTIATPSLPNVSADPRVIAARSTLAGLQTQYSALDGELQHTLSAARLSRAGATQEAKARAMAYGVELAPADGPTVDISATNRELLTLQRAVEIAGERVEEAVRDASKDALPAVYEAYFDLTRRMVTAARVLADLADQERDFIGSLLASGLRPIALQRLTVPIDHNTLDLLISQAERMNGVKLQ